MAERRIETIHIATRAEVKLEYRHPGSDVDFPSDWFDSHPGEKPSLLVPGFTGDPKDLIQAVKGGIRGANLTLETVKQYLHYYGSKMGDIPNEEWSSFNRVIGDGRAQITPWNIVTVNRGPDLVPTETMIDPSARPGHLAPDDPQNWTERAMALYILCLNRLIKIKNEEYADHLQKRMEDQVIAEGGKGMSFHGAKGIYSSWLSNRGFLKMVAAIDMFLHKFKDHPDGILRLGSLDSRFRDCAGLLSMGYAMSILNIKAGELMDWVFIKTMGDEVLQMTRDGQESGKADSYFAYQSDLGLVTKSAYSSNANPYLFTWIHVFGTLLGHRRSQNARFIFEGSYSDVGLNAVLIAWVYGRGGELTTKFEGTGQDYGKEILPLSEEGEDDEQLSPEDITWLNTQGRNPKTWYAILKSGGFKVPAAVVKAMRRQREKLREVREDTVGDYVKHRFIF